jgi:hypothetical protein
MITFKVEEDVSMKRCLSFPILFALLFFSFALAFAQEKKAGDEALGTRKYAAYEKPQVCGASCHVDFVAEILNGNGIVENATMLQDKIVSIYLMHLISPKHFPYPLVSSTNHHFPGNFILVARNFSLG